MRGKFTRSQVSLSASDVLNNYLGLIAAGRAGLLEKELREILALGDDLFTSITKALSHFIITRKQFLHFFHPEFERTIQIRQGKAGMRQHHRALAQYLRQKGYQYIRSIDELPYQLQWSKDYSSLLAIFADSEFLQEKSRQWMIVDLYEDIDSALYSVEAQVPRDAKIELAPEVSMTRELLQLLARILEIELPFLQRRPQCLFQTLWNYGYWHDCPVAKDHYQPYDDTADVPWEREGDKLYRLVEYWRERQRQDLVWYKSRRPLFPRLDFSLNKIFRGHLGSVNRVCYNQTGDLIASASDDHTVRVWDANTGFCCYILRGHEDVVSGVCFCPDSSLLASSSHDTTIRLWDLDDGQCIQILQTGHKVNDVGYHPKGQYLASAHHDGAIRIWQENEVVRSIQRHTREVERICYSPDGAQIASASYDGALCVSDAATGECLAKFVDDPKNFPTCVSYHPDGKQIVVGYANNAMQMWDIDEQRRVRSFFGHKWRVHEIHYRPDGTQIASSSQDGMLRVWDSATGECLEAIPVHERHVLSVAYHPQGEFLASGSFDKTVRVSKPGSYTFVPKLVSHERIVTSFLAHANGWMATHALDEKVRLWDCASGVCQRIFVGEEGETTPASSIPGYEKDLENIACPDDGNHIAAGFRNAKIRLWDLRSGEQIHELSGHSKWVKCVAYSPDGKYLASASDDKTIRIWDVASGACIRIFSGHAFPIVSLHFHPDGRRLVSASLDTTVRIWDIAADNCLHVLHGHEDFVNRVRYSPDGSRIVSASVDQTLQLWDADQGTSLMTWQGHQGDAKRIAFSLQGDHLFSVARNNTIRQWQVADGKCTKEITGWGNPQSLAAGGLRIIVRDAETIIEDPDNGRELAWFPYTIDDGTWILPNLIGGYNEHHVYLLELVAPAEMLAKQPTVSTEIAKKSTGTTSFSPKNAPSTQRETIDVSIVVQLAQGDVRYEKPGLFERLIKRNWRELSPEQKDIVDQIVSTTISIADRDTLLSTILQQIVERHQLSSHACILLCDEDCQRFAKAADNRVPGTEMGIDPLSIPTSFLQEILAQQIAVVIGETIAPTESPMLTMESQAVSIAALIPMVNKAKPWGILYCHVTVSPPRWIFLLELLTVLSVKITPPQIGQSG